MPYYMNVFPEEFRTELLFDPGLKYILKGNPNRPEIMTAWRAEPYDLSVANLFAIAFSFDGGRSWGMISVTLTASAGRTAQQVADELNSDESFSAVFLAYAEVGTGGRPVLKIKRNGRVFDKFRAYIPNTSNASAPTASAERIFQFNAKADILALPSTFDSYTVEAKKQDPDSVFDAKLVKVDPALEGYVLDNRGLPYGTKQDYEMLLGRSERFVFKNVTTDPSVSNRVLDEIEYTAGSVAGSLGRRTIYEYDAGNNTANANRIFQIPWTLRTEDLVYPPAEVSMSSGFIVSGEASASHA